MIVLGHRFFIDFESILASNMGPSWEPRRLKIRKNGLLKLLRMDLYLAVNTTLLLDLVLDRLGLHFEGVRARFLEVFG